MKTKESSKLRLLKTKYRKYEKKVLFKQPLQEEEKSTFRYDMCTSEKAVEYYRTQRAKYPMYKDFERESVKRFLKALETTSPEIRANFVCEL
jgi:hypothetical protein